MGSDLYSHWLRKACRDHVLQVSAGVTQIFELPSSHDINRLSWLLHDEVSLALQEEVARDFLAEPCGCRSFAGHQLAMVCPTVPELLSVGRRVLYSNLSSTGHVIDFSERSHAQLRRVILPMARLRTSWRLPIGC